MGQDFLDEIAERVAKLLAARQIVDLRSIDAACREYTLAEVAELIGRSKQTVRRYVHDPQNPMAKASRLDEAGRIKIPYSALREYQESRRRVV